MQREKDRLILAISRASDKYGEKLLQFMGECGIIGLYEATEDQLRSFMQKEGIPYEDGGSR